MSTRCVIAFHYGNSESPIALIYKDYDGHPESVAFVLTSFFDDVETQCGPRPDDNRFTDPSFLAAKYIVWQAAEYARESDKPMDFSGVAPVLSIPRDVEWIHTVRCSDDRSTERCSRPTVTSAPRR